MILALAAEQDPPTQGAMAVPVSSATPTTSHLRTTIRLDSPYYTAQSSSTDSLNACLLLFKGTANRRSLLVRKGKGYISQRKFREDRADYIDDHPVRDYAADAPPELWQNTHLSSLKNGTYSIINAAGNLTGQIHTRLLHHFSRKVARDSDDQAPCTVIADYCSKEVVTLLISYLEGEESLTSLRLQVIPDICLIDFGSLVFHLEIPSFQILANSEICRRVIEQGSIATRPMMIHVSMTCSRDDPIRQILRDSAIHSMRTSRDRLKVTKSFRESGRLAKEELRDHMWLGELKRDLENHTSFRNLPPGSRHDYHLNANDITQPSRLEIVIDSIQRAIDCSALDPKAFFMFLPWLKLTSPSACSVSSSEPLLF